jgi:hypothetical protein
MNIYYNPEGYGLEVVGVIERSDGDYQFDMVAVWRESRGRYWIGQDSGCSCPSPFEDIYDINQLDGPHNKAGLRKRLDYIRENESDYCYLSTAEFKREISEILSRLP